MAAKGKHAAAEHVLAPGKCHAETRDRAGDLQIFSLTLSQLSYRGSVQKLHADAVDYALYTLGGNTILGSLWIRCAGFWLLWPSGPRILSRDWCKELADVRIHTWNNGPNVASEDQPHDLRVMRPTRCQLHYCHLSWADKQHVQALVGRQKQNIG